LAERTYSPLSGRLGTAPKGKGFTRAEVSGREMVENVQEPGGKGGQREGNRKGGNSQKKKD